MARFEARRPDNIEFTLTITMTLKEWKDLKERVGYNENWAIADAISKMTADAEKVFYTEIKPPQEQKET